MIWIHNLSSLLSATAPLVSFSSSFCPHVSFVFSSLFCLIFYISSRVSISLVFLSDSSLGFQSRVQDLLIGWFISILLFKLLLRRQIFGVYHLSLSQVFRFGGRGMRLSRKLKIDTQYEESSNSCFVYQCRMMTHFVSAQRKRRLLSKRRGPGVARDPFSGSGLAAVAKLNTNYRCCEHTV